MYANGFAFHRTADLYLVQLSGLGAGGDHGIGTARLSRRSELVTGSLG